MAALDKPFLVRLRSALDTYYSEKSKGATYLELEVIKERIATMVVDCGYEIIRILEQVVGKSQ